MGPSSRDRMIEFAGHGRLPLDDEHPVWAKCRELIAAAAHGEIVALEQSAATPDPPTTAPGDKKKAGPPALAPTAEQVLAAVTATPGAAAAPLAAAIGTTAAAMAPVMAAAIKAGFVRTTGARRAKRYWLAEPAIHAPEPTPAEAERQPGLPLDTDCPAEPDEPAEDELPHPSAERRRQEPQA